MEYDEFEVKMKAGGMETLHIGEGDYLPMAYLTRPTKTSWCSGVVGSLVTPPIGQWPLVPPAASWWRQNLLPAMSAMRLARPMLDWVFNSVCRCPFQVRHFYVP